MSKLVDDLEDLIRTETIAQLPEAINSNLSLHDVLIIFFAWQARLIPQAPRCVHISPEFERSPRRVQHQDDLEVLTRKIESGADLKPHLSKSADKVLDLSARGPHRSSRDRDLLLADWGIHHLHLRPLPKRSGDLLFAVFDPNDAYLIGVYPHRSWGLRELVEILVRNWPGVGSLTPSRIAGMRLSQNYTEEEGLSARESGVTLFLEVDGQVYAPVPGITTAGTPTDATLRANSIHWGLDALRGEADLEGALSRQASAPSSRWQADSDGAGHFGFSNGHVFARCVSLVD